MFFTIHNGYARILELQVLGKESDKQHKMKEGITKSIESDPFDSAKSEKISSDHLLLANRS